MTSRSRVDSGLSACELAVWERRPAGLAVAIEAARRGIDGWWLERRTGPRDKACGEV